MAGKSALLSIKIIADALGAKKAAKETGDAYKDLDKTLESSGSKGATASDKISSATSKTTEKLAETGKAGTDVGDKIADGVGKADGKFTGLISTIKKVGVTAAISLGATMVATVLKGSIDGAKELQQAYKGLDATFGENAGAMREWAAQAAESVGLAKSEYATLATTIGNSLTQVGFPMDEIAQKSNDLVTLGADLATVYGGTTREAVDKLAAALTGSSASLGQYNIDLSNSAVEAWKAANGAEGMSDAQARLAMLQEQTTAVQGAYAASTGELGQKQQEFQAKLDNLRAELGEKLMPVMEKAMTFMIDYGVPALEATATMVGFLAEGFNMAADAVEPMVSGLKSSVEWVKNNDAAMSILNGVIRTLQGMLGTTVGQLNPLKSAFDRVKGAVDAVSGAVETLIGWLGKVGGGVLDKIKNILPFAAPSASALAWPAAAGPPVPGPRAAGLADSRAGLVRAVSGATNLTVLIDGSQLQGRINSTVRSALSADGARLAGGGWV
ncbi:hypothetical protein [Catenulispora pinisilvae]|uniref:hypothetical protein n=1 Tax=Catenulispora pinisilvae TaxID=2705253 RepID=UPI001891CD26|nr:hypothetical protein [Catenulispora pinisilvae]